jgi:ribonucleotide reductase beta subunit family protein with ferritin-like domain
LVFIFLTELQLTDEQLENLTLLEIEQYLQANRRTLKQFPCIPYPKGYVLQQLGNRLIYDERNYNVEDQKQEFAQLSASLTGYFTIKQCTYNK